MRSKLLLAVLGFLAAASLACADEGLWLFTEPPRQQLKAQYDFALTDALLERLQKASVMVGRGGSGSFVSADGLVLTNHHVGLEWLQELSKAGADLVREGFYANQRDKELRCAGLELRVLWSMEDVSARVHRALKPDMSTAQASKAREAVCRAIEEESRRKTGLVSEMVSLHHGSAYHLYRYKKYTDIRLVFAPEQDVARVLDVCFFRAYEKGKPARIIHHLAWSATAPQTGALILISGYPGSTERFRTAVDLEDLYGAQNLLRFKLTSRLSNSLAEYCKANPENERHARFEAHALDNEVGRLLSSLDTQEMLLARIRTREEAEQSLLVRENPEAASLCKEAFQRIAACKKAGVELSQSYFFLESASAFQTSLFDYARDLLRLAEESAKPDGKRLLEYCRANRGDVQRSLLEPKTIVKEMEIVKLTESLDLFVRYAGADADLAAKILDGKTPRERARALIEGSQLDDVEVRKALIQGGSKAVTASQDSMLTLARLVDARSRKVRQELEEKVWEPCRQAYTVLARVRKQAMDDETYPDATGSLRLSFGKLRPYSDSKTVLGSRTGIATLADFFRCVKESRQENKLPLNWQTAMGKVNEEAPLLFMNSADLVPGNSGSPVVDRQGQVVGVAAWVPNMVNELAYLDDESGSGAVAAQGILEVLDKVYHAVELVKELSGKDPACQDLAREQKAVGLPSALIPSIPPFPSVPEPAIPGSPPITATAPLSFASDPKTTPLLGSSTAIPIPSPFPALSPAAGPLPSLARRNKELVPALLKALKDSDQEVGQAAATALGHLGEDALPALIEALQAQDKTLRSRAALALGKMEHQRQNAINALLKALEDEDVEVRRQAASALAAVVQDRRQTSEAPRCP